MTEFDYQKPPEENPEPTPADTGEEQVDSRMLMQRVELLRLEYTQEISQLRAEIESLRGQLNQPSNSQSGTIHDLNFAPNPDANSRVDEGRPMDLSHQTYRPQPSWNPDMATLLNRIEKLETQPDRKQLWYRDVFWGKVSGNVAANGTCTFKEQFNNSNGIVAMPGGRSANATANMTEVNGKGGASNGTNVLVMAYQNANTTQYSYLTVTSPYAVFGVRLFKDGGVTGSNTTTCNLTYTCKDIANNSLSNGSSNTTTTATPKGNVRLANVTYSTPSNGTFGEAFYDNSSPPVLILCWAFDEKPTPTQC